jgi:guanine deaminase
MPYSEQFLREAIRLSEEKMTAGEGGPFGAVVVKDGTVIGRGWNRVTSANDPTAHAEMEAIRSACARLKTFALTGCEIYASCEPCPMCLAAIYWARLEAVYFAAAKIDAAEAGFDDALLDRELSMEPARRRLVMEQYLPEEARRVFKAWMNKTDRIPY